MPNASQVGRLFHHDAIGRAKKRQLKWAKKNEGPMARTLARDSVKSAANQYLLMIDTPTFWKVVICSSTCDARSSPIVSVIIDFGLSLPASTICNIEG